MVPKKLIKITYGKKLNTNSEKYISGKKKANNTIQRKNTYKINKDIIIYYIKYLKNNKSLRFLTNKTRENKHTKLDYIFKIIIKIKQQYFD